MQSSWARVNSEDSEIEQNRRITAEEEQELWDFDASPWESAPAFNGDPDSQRECLNSLGLLRWNELLTRDEAATLRIEIDKLIEEAKEEVIRGDVGFIQRFGPCIGRRNRCDVLLPLEGLVLSAVTKILSEVSGVICDAVGENATLCELSALTSDPGAPAQQVHHDTKFDSYPRRISILCALNDVSEEMGPTILWAGTNTRQWHEHFKERGEELEELLESGHIRGTLSAGDAILYDTNLLHCGGENRGEERRMLLVISAQDESTHGTGNVLNTHIRSELRGRFRICSVHDWEL